MTINISTNSTEVARFAGAVYGLVLDYATMNEVLATANSVGLDNVINGVFTADFGTATDASVATTIATNLGLTGTLATGAENYITGVLAGTAPAAKGVAIMNMLNLFASLATDATWGTAVTAWENTVANAVNYGQDAANVVNTTIQAVETQGQTFTLTQGTDHFTGGPSGHNIFNGFLDTPSKGALPDTSTFTAFDTLNGGTGGNNVFNLTADNTQMPVGISVTNIQTMNLNLVKGTGSAVNYNVSGFTGLNTLNVTQGTANAATTVTTDAPTVTMAGGGAFTLTDGTTTGAITSLSVSANTGAVTTSGVSALTSVSLTNENQNVTISNATAKHTQNLALNQVTGGTITDAAATTVSVSTSGTASKGVTLATAAATAMTVSAAVNLSLNAATTVNQAALATITGTGAGALTWDVSAIGATLTDVNLAGSSGNNTIILNAAKTTFEGGSGNDTVTVAAAPTVALNGGAGVNTIIENATTDILTGVTTLTNFQTLGLGAVAAVTNYDATGFSHLSVNGITNAGTVTAGFANVAAGTDLTLTGNAGTITYALANSTGTADVLALTLNDAGTNGAYANTVIASGIETVNITADSTAATASTESLTLTDTAVKTITVGGTMGGFTLVDTATTITSVNASGLTGGGFTWTAGALANAATIVGSTAGGDTINAAAATKAVTITETGGSSTLTGSANADTINAGGGKNVVVGGLGADTINFSGTGNTEKLGNADSGTNTATSTQTAVITTTFDVVNGVVAGDKIDLSGMTVASTSVANATHLTGTDTVVEFAHGVYSGGTFTFNTAGADTLVTYETTGTGVYSSIVLVGFAASAATGHSTISGGIVTLG